MIELTGVAQVADDKACGLWNPGFLSDCPKKIADLFHYWNARRDGRLMPARADIDPVEMTPHLSGLLLVDVEGVDAAGHGIFRYRVVGTNEVQLRGHDPTGKLVQDGFLGPSLEDVLACYETVRQERSFLYDPDAYMTHNGRWRDDCTLFLPLSEDGATVSQILVYAVTRQSGSRL